MIAAMVTIPGDKGNKPIAKKKHRAKFSVHLKYEFIQYADKTRNLQEAVDHFNNANMGLGLTLNTAKQWRKKPNRQEIERSYNCGRLSLSKIAPSRYPAFEKVLEEWVNVFLEQKALPLTLAIVKQKAQALKEQLLENNSVSNKEKENLRTKFNASQKWAVNFMKARNLKSKILHGEAGGVNHKTIKEAIEALNELILQFDAECVYNMDETGLLFKLLPNHTYVKHENAKDARGNKLMNQKDRMSLYLATNLTGSDKIPIAAIGKSATPRCFKARLQTAGKLPIKYFHQKKAWSDGPTFVAWFKEVFLPHIRRRTNKKVLLILDNCGPHGTEIEQLDNRKQIKIAFLPPNCTSVHQPMDAGVISWVKRRYRHKMLAKMIENYEKQLMDQIDKRNEEERNETGSATAPPPSKKKTKGAAGTEGIGEGKMAHVLDAMDIIKECWDDLDERTIARCWNKTGLVTGINKERFQSTHAKKEQPKSTTTTTPSYSQLAVMMKQLPNPKDIAEKALEPVESDLMEIITGIEEMDEDEVEIFLHGWDDEEEYLLEHMKGIALQEAIEEANNEVDVDEILQQKVGDAQSDVEEDEPDKPMVEFRHVSFMEQLKDLKNEAMEYGEPLSKVFAALKLAEKEVNQALATQNKLNSKKMRQVGLYGYFNSKK